ncbi:MAG: U32 family peptidase [bacterium]|nr:U32 family peptidase [bacterium]
MPKNFELLAPGGDLDSIKAAIAGGADAIYCGLSHFNARNRAKNISFEDFCRVIKLAHNNHCQVFLTLNIIILESEFPTLIKLLNKLANKRVDGIIVQDLGLFYLLSTYFENLDVHASTQCTTHNSGQINFLKKLSVTRVNLSRELNIQEIKDLTESAHQNNILTEVFVHGSYCIAFSGLCNISSVVSGKSGNRGQCSQPCRDQYLTTSAGKDFPLNMKDNSAFFDLDKLSDAGVDSLKIEGRIKKFHYVYTVVDCWRKQLSRYYSQNQTQGDSSNLYKVFNRDFSNSYLTGKIGSDMFIDNPFDNSLQHLSQLRGHSEDKQVFSQELYDEKEEMVKIAQNKIQDLVVEKTPLTLNISGKINSLLKVTMEIAGKSFDLYSESNLIAADRHCIKRSSLQKRFRLLNTEEFFIQDLNLDQLQDGLFIPFPELSSMSKRAQFILNGERDIVAPIDLPVLKKETERKINPSLSILISSPADLNLCERTSTDVYYELPSCFKSSDPELEDLFLKNKDLIPWFPPILIGEDFNAAANFLKRIQPKRIVTNNTGIAYSAFENGIPWIAGPHLQTANSFTLQAMKEKFNCCGAFLSNELNKNQIEKIAPPADFKLYYSIYHPILLMTSRQCLFLQVTGCSKSTIDSSCLPECTKTASIENLKDASFLIDKQPGDYNSLFNSKNLLNLDILDDLPDFFSGFMIDLRDIGTETDVGLNKAEIVNLFDDSLSHDPEAKEFLKQTIGPWTNDQYRRGL